jgi:TldD protein
MVERPLLAEIIQFAVSKNVDFAEIYVEEKQASNIFCEDNKIERVFSGREKGAGIRVIKNYNTAYVYTNDLTKEGLLKAAHTASRAVNDKPNQVQGLIELNPRSASFSLECQRQPGNVSFEEKIGYVLSANQAARRVSPLIRQVTVTAADIQKKMLIANSEGDLIEDSRSRVRFVINTVSEKEGIIQTGYESAGGVCGWELLDEISMEVLAVKAAELSVSMLSARPAPAGRMPVVMSAEAGGTMVHEACGHGLEADLVQKGLSVYRGKLGQLVAAACVNVIDDATIPNRYGSYVFDDEGIAGQRTILIENGVLKAYMYDRLTARKDGLSSTGNGRRESYQQKPVVRMSNTLILPGQDDPEEIIANTDQGLLVKKMGGGQVNTTNGDFVFDVQEGYIIKNGKIAYPVRGATLIGNGPLALSNIDRVGNDLGFGIGVCGKDGQGVPVADAQPTIRIKELTVGGTTV